MVKLSITALSLVIGFQSCTETTQDSQQPNSQLSELMTHRNTVNEEMRNPDHSPLHADSIPFFKGLKYYPIEDIFRVKCRVERIPNPSSIEMATTTERMITLTPFADLHFTIDNQNLKLLAYKFEDEGDILFIPFLDLTNGDKTYGGGRYVEIEQPIGDSCEVDFNYAYNPYCAYNHDYSCPIPPLENTLDIAIEAGEKTLYTY